MITDIKLTINGVEIPSDQYIISQKIADNKLQRRHTISVHTDIFSNDPQGQRLEHQLQALRWLQGKCSDQFVIAWIGMYHDSLERAGGTPNGHQ